MIEKGANVNQVNRQGETCIFGGTYWLNVIIFSNNIKLFQALNDIDKVKTLLDAGADINIADINGETPIFFGTSSLLSLFMIINKIKTFILSIAWKKTFH